MIRTPSLNDLKAFFRVTNTINELIDNKEIYTENQLKEFLKQRVGQWMKPEDIDAMFSWL